MKLTKDKRNEKKTREKKLKNKKGDNKFSEIFKTNRKRSKTKIQGRNKSKMQRDRNRLTIN